MTPTLWLKTFHKLLNVKAIEIHVGCPPHTFQKVVQGKREVPKKWNKGLQKLIDEIGNYDH